LRVLHVVKTSDGAVWAARQAQVLAASGVDVHVVVPSLSGEAVSLWRRDGITLHEADFALPLSSPHRFAARVGSIRQLVDAVRPDVIHSHFVTTTLMLRLALRGFKSPLRLFQVPGPLHMEHALYRLLDRASAEQNDQWIASSDYTRRLYHAAGVDPSRIFLSYYGTDVSAFASMRTGELRHRLGIPPEAKVVGNISYMYPPKYYLGQRRGIKGHEDLIDALGKVCSQRSDVIGVLAGAQWGGGDAYFERLRARARAVAGDRIILPGRVPHTAVGGLWADFDCVIHAPRSENCGGVVEPLVSLVPTIATNVGGLPEVVLDGLTGWIVESGDVNGLAATIIEVVTNRDEGGRRAALGRRLVHTMFDVRRTAGEVLEIYHYLLDRAAPSPESFNPRAFLATSDSA
jgi:glycosyltransferase involved in cell wall biosynthesis